MRKILLANWRVSNEHGSTSGQQHCVFFPVSARILVHSLNDGFVVIKLCELLGFYCILTTAFAKC